MASKALLSFGVATATSAVLLYLGGVRVHLELDSSDGSPQQLVNMVQYLRTEYGSPAATQTNYTCSYTEMKPKFLSYDPIMVYIENFMSPYEREHLVELAEAEYAPSVVQNPNHEAGTENFVDTSSRKSETAWLRDGDPVVDCVKSRAATFQGLLATTTEAGAMEELAVLKYREGGSFETHYDWHASALQPVDRVTSFFATLAASPDIEGGATWFPLVPRPAWHDLSPWCESALLDCKYSQGLAVRPIPGNAVFWVNFRRDGTGHRGTAHGGQPVVRGQKIGLNIWTRGKVNGNV